MSTMRYDYVMNFPGYLPDTDAPADGELCETRDDVVAAMVDDWERYYDDYQDAGVPFGDDYTTGLSTLKMLREDDSAESVMMPDGRAWNIVSVPWPDDDDVRTVTRAYLRTLIWTDLEETMGDDAPDVDDLPGGVTDPAADDVRDFLEHVARRGIYGDTLAKVDLDQLGHDFALTRNHHGAGFWDRGLGTLGDDLTEAAHAQGSALLDTWTDPSDGMGRVYYLHG